MKQIRRSLLIVASLIGFLPVLTRATQNSAASGPVVAHRSLVGTGLDSLVYWSTALPFLDVFKTSGPWMSGTADAWDDHRPLDLDEHGWVRSLLPGQRAITLMMYGQPMWVNGIYRAPLGKYTVQYDGEGTLEYYGASVVQSDPGRDVIDLQPQPNEGLALIITSVNPNNYLRNIRVLMPGATTGETFNPRFLDSLRGYATVRFLSWMTGSNPEDYAVTPHTWATRPTRQDARWESTHRGAPVEIMVDLCNRLHVNPWFSIPHLADDDFVRNFAQTVHDSLDPGLKVYVEHSNEVWNQTYQSQYNYAAQSGLALGLSTDPDQARQRYNALRTRQIGAIFREVLGRDRVVVVLSSFTEIASISEEMLSWNGTAPDVDALAIAPYFGYELGLTENDSRVAQMSLDDLFHDLKTNWIPAMNSATEQQAAVARQYGVPLISYEGGQHLANLDGQSSAKVNALFDAANRDPRMGQIYSQYLEDWNRISGGGLWMHLMNCGEAGSVGRWGAMEYLGQPRSEAPKYDAIQRWIEQSYVNPFNFADRGGMSVSTHGGNGSTTVGYAQIQTAAGNVSPAGLAIFGFRQNGILVTEAGVPASPLVQSGRIYTEVAGAVNTGIAIANPNNQPATISYYFTDSTGQNVGQGTTTLDANAQIAKFLNEPPFGLTSSSGGTLTFNSPVPISVIALRGFTNQRSEFLITTLPLVDITTSSTAPIVFPHFADGGGWTTQVVLVNPTDGTLSGTTQFLSQGTSTTSGSPISLTANGQSSSSFQYAIPPRSSYLLRTSGLGTNTQSGWVRVAPTSGTIAPSGLVVFSYTNAAGITISEAGVPALGTGTAFRMYAEMSGATGQIGSIRTGIAIANPGLAPAVVNLDLTTLTGSPNGMTASLTVPASGQIAKFLNEIFAGLGSFQGVLRVSSNTRIAVTGLRTRYNERSEFLATTTAPVNENTAAPGAALVFPHFADGGGYTTQFVILSAIPGQSTSGILQLTSKSGEPLNLMLQ